jgi:hypothetical protein
MGDPKDSDEGQGGRKQGKHDVMGMEDTNKKKNPMPLA